MKYKSMYLKEKEELQETKRQFETFKKWIKECVESFDIEFIDVEDDMSFSKRVMLIKDKTVAFKY